MAITKDQKTQILQELVDKFGRSKSVVFSDYRGLDVASVSDLRNKLREKDAETKVAKKTLIKLAAKENNIDGLGDEMLTGPVSATFSYEDEMAGLKVLFNFSKVNENLKLLGGVINGEVVGADEIIQLAKLPGREELLAKLIGSMNAPVSGFVGILGNLLGGFVRVLNAYKDTLPAEAVQEAPKEEPAPVAETPAPAEESVSTDTAGPQGDAVETAQEPSQEEEKKEE
ncbi:50S ribosomal protein L10 [Candidatus Peregrinibacteria bacterium]|nr:50S ribosomal protein L10 [Candidatus Peregrinibacteria bacterium]